MEMPFGAPCQPGGCPLAVIFLWRGKGGGCGTVGRKPRVCVVYIYIYILSRMPQSHQSQACTNNNISKQIVFASL